MMTDKEFHEFGKELMKHINPDYDALKVDPKTLRYHVKGSSDDSKDTKRAIVKRIQDDLMDLSYELEQLVNVDD